MNKLSYWISPLEEAAEVETFCRCVMNYYWTVNIYMKGSMQIWSKRQTWKKLIRPSSRFSSVSDIYIILKMFLLVVLYIHYDLCTLKYNHISLGFGINIFVFFWLFGYRPYLHGALHVLLCELCIEHSGNKQMLMFLNILIHIIVFSV